MLSESYLEVVIDGEKKSGKEKETPRMSRFFVESQGTGEFVELSLNVEEISMYRILEGMVRVTSGRFRCRGVEPHSSELQGSNTKSLKTKTSIESI